MAGIVPIAIGFDKNEGRLVILCYRRDGSPAAAWINNLKVGDPCEVFAPLGIHSIFQALMEKSCFLVTKHHLVPRRFFKTRQQKAHLFFELTSVQDSTEVLKQIGVKEPGLTEQSSDGSHLQKIVREIADLHSRNSLSMAFFY